MEYLIIHKDGRQGVGSPSADPKTWLINKACGFCEPWSDKNVEKIIRIHPGLIDPLVEAKKLDESGPADPQTWRESYEIVDRGITLKKAVVTYKVRLIDSDDVMLALESTCDDPQTVADDWGIPEEALLELISASQVERCTTCGWWSHEDELYLVDEEYKCLDCQEAE